MHPEPPASTTSFSCIRALPVSVHPANGETSRSYFHRLAAANSLSTETMWGHIRTLHPTLPAKNTPHLATTELEALGGLPEHWFTENRAHHLLPIRCPHNKWRLRICDICSTTPGEGPGCRRCSAGVPTQVTTATGAICLRHRRWIHNGADLDVSHLPHHLAAEKRFRSSRSLPRAERGFFELYPEIVELTITLTDPRFTEVLMHPRWSPSQQALLLSRAIAARIGNPLSAPCITGLWETVYQDRRAVQAAYGMTDIISKRKCCKQRALCAAAYTHRACLLRHLDAKHLPDQLPITKTPALSVKATICYQQHPTGTNATTAQRRPRHGRPRAS